MERILPVHFFYIEQFLQYHFSAHIIYEVSFFYIEHILAVHFLTLNNFCSTISPHRLYMNYDSFGQCATHEKQGQAVFFPSKLTVLDLDSTVETN